MVMIYFRTLAGWTMLSPLTGILVLCASFGLGWRSRTKLNTEFVDRYFGLTENHTSIKQELLGGLTTFVTMAYIVVVNPQILSQAGMPPDGEIGRAHV